MLITAPVATRKLCLEQLGAEKYIDFTQEKDIPAKVKEITTYGAHGSIVFAATKASYALGPNVVSIHRCSLPRQILLIGCPKLRPGGTMVVVGLPPDETVVAGVSPIQFALNRLNIVGSVTGTLKVSHLLELLKYVLTLSFQDVEECLEFTARGLVHPILTKGTLHDVDKFCELMIAGKLPGRAVMKVVSD